MLNCILFTYLYETVNTFKQRLDHRGNGLDKFWIDQDVMYNYKADLHGIGNRSIIVNILCNIKCTLSLFLGYRGL